MKKTFKIRDLFRSAWKDYKANWTLFILIGIVFLLVGLLGNLGTTLDPYTQSLHQSPIIGILSWLLQMFVGLGFIRFTLNLVDGKEHKIEDLFKGAESFSHFAYFIVVAMLYGALIGLGTLLLVIPGIIALIGFIFAQYLIAEQKTGIFEAFKESWKMTAGNRFKIFWLMIVLIFFNLLGVIALVVGLIITVPMSYIMYARLYRTLGGAMVDAEENDMEVVDIMEGDQTEENSEE